MLVGVYCNTPDSQMLVAHTLRESLHLLAYNIQQPALDATAIILGVSAHEINKYGERFTQTSPWNQSAEQIKNGISNVLLAGNKNAFLDNAEKWLNTSRDSKLSSIFHGHLIHGISTEFEADFVRRNGGTMVHIINAEHHRKINVGNHDLAAYCVGSEEPSLITLTTIAKTYRARALEQELKAA